MTTGGGAQRDVLRRHGVHDARILDALTKVPRVGFLPPDFVLSAAEDRTFTLAPGVDFVAPSVLGRLLESLELTGTERVLAVGGGNAYPAAVLAVMGIRAEALVDEERRPEAQRRLARLGLGLPVHAEAVASQAGVGFDRILVAAPVTVLPEDLTRLLAPEGRLVAALRGGGPVAQRVELRRRLDGSVARRELGPMPLAFRIGDLLVEAGAVQRDEVEKAAKEIRGSLGQGLLERGLVQEQELFRALALQQGIRFAGAEELLTMMDQAIALAIPRAFLEARRLLPIGKHDGTLLVASTQPDASVAELEKAAGATASALVLVTPTDFRRLRTAIDLGIKAPVSAGPSAEDLLEKHPLDDAHLVALFDAILLEAIGERASDIHLERYGARVRVRLRIDGDLRDVAHITLSAHELAGVINVLKVASNLDIAERRMPQGGRFRRRAGEHVFDLRVQTQPSLHGEHAVVRLLPQTTQLLSIEELGFDAATAQIYRRLLDSPAGLVLVVGPTGSGKSTTLYAALQVLARDTTRKVITVEDPIEYSLDNVQQTQTNADVGFRFADAMRSFVRQDPDVILVGEIRDDETALEALRASQTGHVVLSTLHCNDAVDSVQRLLDLGMHPNSIASELLAVIAQRLAKRICRACRVEASPDAAVLAELFPRGAPPDFPSFVGKGCDRCRGRGTHGRIAVIEFLRATPEVRSAVARRATVDELRAIAKKAGLHPMRASALRLVREGVIPMTELPQILSLERMAED